MYKTSWTRYGLQFQSLSNFTCKLWMMRWRTHWFWVARSKVKVTFGTVYKPCGYDTDCSLSQITFKFHIYIVHGKRRNPIDFDLRGQRSMSTLALYLLIIVGTVYRLQFFAWSPMIRGGTLLILSHLIKGQDQLWLSVCETLWARYRLWLTSNCIVDDERRYSNHLISLWNAHFHWLKCALPGKVITASPYPEVPT